MQKGCILASISPTRTEGAVKAVPVPVWQDQRLWVSGTPEGAGGRWWQTGSGGLS